MDKGGATAGSQGTGLWGEGDMVTLAGVTENRRGTRGSRETGWEEAVADQARDNDG